MSSWLKVLCVCHGGTHLLLLQKTINSGFGFFMRDIRGREIYREIYGQMATEQFTRSFEAAFAHIYGTYVNSKFKRVCPRNLMTFTTV